MLFSDIHGLLGIIFGRKDAGKPCIFIFCKPFPGKSDTMIVIKVIMLCSVSMGNSDREQIGKRFADRSYIPGRNTVAVSVKDTRISRFAQQDERIGKRFEPAVYKRAECLPRLCIVIVYKSNCILRLCSNKTAIKDLAQIVAFTVIGCIVEIKMKRYIKQRQSIICFSR